MEWELVTPTQPEKLKSKVEFLPKPSFDKIKSMLSSLRNLDTVLEAQKLFKSMCAHVTVESMDLGSSVIILIYRIFSAKKHY